MEVYNKISNYMKKQLIILLSGLLLIPCLAYADNNEGASCNWSTKQENAIGCAHKVYVDFNTKKTIYCNLPLA